MRVDLMDRAPREGFHGRTTLYSRECPSGRIFTSETDFRLALDAGWAEAPWLINTQQAQKVDAGANAEEIMMEDVVIDPGVKRKKKDRRD